MSRFLQRYGPYLAIVALLFFYYPQVFLFQGSWLTADHREQHFPWAAYMSETIKAGKLPFWTDQIGCGFPLAAEGQVGAFYLPNIIISLAMPAAAGYNLNLIIHLVLSGSFFYLFLRNLKISAFAAIFGSIAYLFGSTYAGASYNINSLKCMTWFPLILLLIDKMSVKVRIYQVAILTIVLWQVLLAGHLQCAVYIFLFSAIYFLARNIKSFKNIGESKALFLAAGSSYLTAILLALPRILLTSELYQYSNRINFKEAFAYIGSYNPLAAASFFIPNLDAVFEGKIYMGVVSVFFFIMGAIILWKKKDYTFFWPMLIAIILAPGIFSPIYVALVKFFKFYAFRVPMRFLLFFGFFYSVVAAYGANSLLSGKKQSLDAAKSASGVFLALAAAAIALFSVITISLEIFNKSIYSLGEFLIRNFVFAKPGHPGSMEQYKQALKTYLQGAGSTFNFMTPDFLFPLAVILIAAWLLHSLIRKRISVKSFVWLSFLFLIVDLRTYPLNLVLRDYESFKEYFKKSAIADFLNKDKEDFRIFSFSDDVSLLPLSPSYNMIWKIPTANVYSPLSLHDYHRFLSKMGGVNDSTGTTPVSKDYLYSHLKQLGMLNVKYIITDNLLNDTALRKVWSKGPLHIYRNKFYMPRYWFTEKTQIAKDKERLLEIVQDKNFEPLDIAYLEKDIARYYGIPGKSVYKDSIEVISKNYDSYILQVSVANDKLLMLSQVWYPGWKALIDGKYDIELMKADYLICAIPLAKGNHSVKVYYRPRRLCAV